MFVTLHMSRDPDTLVTSQATSPGIVFSFRQHQLALALAALAFFVISGCSGSNGTPAPVPLPVAANDSYTTGVGQTTLNVIAPGILGNDTGAGLTAVIDSTPAYASSFTLSPDGSFTYTHNNSFPNTTDSFTYHANNAAGNSTIATVQINITPPTAAADTYDVATPGGSALVGSPGVLANDGGTGLTAELITPPAHHMGTFTLNPDGSFTYTHNGNTATTDSFTYRAKIGAIFSNTVSVTININQPPVASNVCPAILDSASAVSVTLPATDPNGAGTIASYTIDSLPFNGSIDGCPGTPCTVGVSVTYRPTPNSTGKRGMDKFTFHVTDSDGLPSPAATAWILNNGKVRIMPLGDSITEGTTVPLPPGNLRGGYRQKLYNDLFTLANGKYAVDFVGEYSNGSSLGIDPNHQGFPGQQDFQLAAGVIGYLNASNADILLLHIGTNAFDPSATDVQTALINIDIWEGSNFPVTVFLAKIIDDIPSFGDELDVPSFNTNLMTMVAGRPSDRIVLVDMHSVLSYGSGGPGPDMADNLHPTQQGYDKMADKWYDDLVNTTAGPKYLGLPQCP